VKIIIIYGLENMSLITKLVQKIKLSLSQSTKEKIKQSHSFHIYEKSVGNWMYPLFSLRWILASFLTSPRKISVDGIELSIPCENWITHFRWFLFKTKETEVRKYIKDVMQAEDVFFDIGANIGVFSVYAAKMHPKSTIYSFEPEYSNLNLLKNNILRNKVNEQVNIFSVGISDEAGFSKLHLSSTDAGAAVHTESKNNIVTTDEGYEVVWGEGIMTTTLDEFCQYLQIIPNCLKIDTDGNELKILKGASSTLKNIRLKSLIIEMPLHDEKQLAECESILIESGLLPTWSDREKTKNEVWTKISN
jgi:FkbM family methyltransferase